MKHQNYFINKDKMQKQAYLHVKDMNDKFGDEIKQSVDRSVIYFRHYADE